MERRANWPWQPERGFAQSSGCLFAWLIWIDRHFHEMASGGCPLTPTNAQSSSKWSTCLFVHRLAAQRSLLASLMAIEGCWYVVKGTSANPLYAQGNIITVGEVDSRHPTVINSHSSYFLLQSKDYLQPVICPISAHVDHFPVLVLQDLLQRSDMTRLVPKWSPSFAHYSGIDSTAAGQRLTEMFCLMSANRLRWLYHRQQHWSA